MGQSIAKGILAALGLLGVYGCGGLLEPSPRAADQAVPRFDEGGLSEQPFHSADWTSAEKHNVFDEYVDGERR